MSAHVLEPVLPVKLLEINFSLNYSLNSVTSQSSKLNGCGMLIDVPLSRYF